MRYDVTRLSNRSLLSFGMELKAKSSRKLQKAVLRTIAKYVGRLRSDQSSQRGTCCGRHVKPGYVDLIVDHLGE